MAAAVVVVVVTRTFKSKEKRSGVMDDRCWFDSEYVCVCVYVYMYIYIYI